MKIRMHSMLRSLALVLAAAALTAGLQHGAHRAGRRPQLHRDHPERAGFNGASLQGPAAVLWFWTPWCPFCNPEAPNVSAVAAANPLGHLRRCRGAPDVAQMQSFVEVQPEPPTSTTPTARSGRSSTCRGSRVRVPAAGRDVDLRQQPDLGDVAAGTQRPGSR